MARNLHRRYGTGHIHFITSSCYRRRAYLDTPARRDLFLEILEQVRRRYDFIVVGYVVMPEHFHLLIAEPERGTQSTIMQVLKQRYTRSILRNEAVGLRACESGNGQHFWQKRFYDFVVLSEEKKIEKLRYIHRNPVKRGLVASPELWRWSSFRFYAFGEEGPVLIDRKRRAAMKVRAPV